MHGRYFRALLSILSLKAIAMVVVLLYAGIGLGPDEAQYWTWSQQLDWGYYSKPPGIAWQIWLSTQLFGNTELGVRFGALVLGTSIPLLVYFLAKQCQVTPLGCFWAAVSMTFAPLGILATFLAITDGGMIFFWTAAAIYFVDKIEKHMLPNYAWLGLLILGGALFKWPIYFFWPIVLGSWLFFPWLVSRKIIEGIAISLAALLPSLYWNVSHEWSTFRHVSATMSGGHAKVPSGVLFTGNFGEFLGAQIALVSPIIFALLCMGLWTVFKYRQNCPMGILFCGGASLISLLVGTCLACFMKMQGNWAIFAYPTAFVVLGWYCCEYNIRGKKWLKGGVFLSIGLCLGLLSIPSIQSQGILAKMPIPYRWNPFRHNIGWNQLKLELENIDYHPAQNFLLSDKYQTTSILSFYSPRQKQAYFFNLHGMRKNQFSFWPGLEQQEKDSGFFVAVENMSQLTPALAERYKKQLSPYFKHVRLLDVKPLFWTYGIPSKGAIIFECEGILGAPKDPALY